MKLAAYYFNLMQSFQKYYQTTRSLTKNSHDSKQRNLLGRVFTFTLATVVSLSLVSCKKTKKVESSDDTSNASIEEQQVTSKKSVKPLKLEKKIEVESKPDIPPPVKAPKVENGSDEIDSVILKVSGGKNSAYINCQLIPNNLASKNKYSIIAATTYELESQGSGTLEERLAAVKPKPFHKKRTGQAVYKSVKWGGTKTTLWIRVFDNAAPDKFVIDEKIQLDYLGRIILQWGKPPSKLISIPEPELNRPQNLVNSKKTLDAQGEIIDIVAAGDGSIVMVRTNQLPYWAPLDVKTGQWLSAPWKASADTLLATQAGKIYLINSKTGLLEVWGLKSGKREGLQLLPFSDKIVSVAAPLNAPHRPLLIATTAGCYFIDPVKFEVISSNLPLESIYDEKETKRRGQLPLDVTSVSLRASDDGALYSFHGVVGKDSPSRVLIGRTFTVDRSVIIAHQGERLKFIASRGRSKTKGYPDHGGKGVKIMPGSTNKAFPSALANIRFMDAGGKKELAVLANAPVLSAKIKDFKGSLMPDRGIYFDSLIGVLLLPENNKLTFYNLKIPKSAEVLPEFIFAGETLSIPLPPGSGFKLDSRDAGKTVLGKDSIRWVAPFSLNSSSQHRLELKWTGELGTQMQRDYKVSVVGQFVGPKVTSRRGSVRVPLRRRLLMKDLHAHRLRFAGSGSVVLVNNTSDVSAWSLITGEQLFYKKMFAKSFIGDADRIYTLSRKGLLTSYDIQTGKELKQVDMGKNMQDITTGISSRGDLMAIEREGARGVLLKISRDKLKSVIFDLTRELGSAFFMPRMVANPSGNLIWSRGVGIFYNKKTKGYRITKFNHSGVYQLREGVPDASGTIIVGRSKIVDLTKPNPQSIELSKMLGFEGTIHCGLDKSGRYLLFNDPKKDPLWRNISIRDVKNPKHEIMSIRYPSEGYSTLPILISETNTLIIFQKVGYRRRPVVYDLNIKELNRKLIR